jgi:hypothetical protein
MIKYILLCAVIICIIKDSMRKGQCCPHACSDKPVTPCAAIAACFHTKPPAVAVTAEYVVGAAAWSLLLRWLSQHCAWMGLLT